MKKIEIDGVIYVSEATLDKDRVIIRSRDSGVHYGFLASKTGDEVVLKNARRLWYWDGAASISEIAVSGVSKPENCKFTVRVPKITVIGVCEIIPCTSTAVKNIEEVPEWTK